VAVEAVAALDDCSPATATTNTDNFRTLVAAGLRILIPLTVFRVA
jgi:hypothetical protein